MVRDNSLFYCKRSFLLNLFFSEFKDISTNDIVTYGIIEIPRYYSISSRKITIAIPKILGTAVWKMDSVNQRSKSDKNLKHNDYDMFVFSLTNRCWPCSVFGLGFLKNK